MDYMNILTCNGILTNMITSQAIALSSDVAHLFFFICSLALLSVTKTI